MRLPLFGNPVAVKELRGRMRGARAFVLLTLYLTLMSGFMLLLYVLSASARELYGYTTGGQIGQTLFAGIIGIELFLVTFIAPALTAGSISGERERQTYDLLRTTMLPARALVTGKLFSALAYVLLLLLAAVPLQSIAFLFGGVSEIEIVLASVILMITAVLLGAIGIYASAAAGRTSTANVSAYGLTLALTLGMPLVVFVLVALFGTRLQGLSIEAQQVLLYALLAFVVTNPLATAYATQFWLIQTNSIGLIQQTLTDSVTGASVQVTILSPWIVFGVLYLVVSALIVRQAVRRVRRIEA